MLAHASATSRQAKTKMCMQGRFLDSEFAMAEVGLKHWHGCACKSDLASTRPGGLRNYEGVPPAEAENLTSFKKNGGRLSVIDVVL